MSVKVSVIIPVYNAETYLPQCIESLINQTLKECEFIFINDGSTDKSKQIIEEYRQKDNRIKQLNQANGGVSSARNAGLKIAHGKYIGFVDADDYVEADMYESLYTAAIQSEVDIVFSNFESEIDGHKVITKYHFPVSQLLDRNYIETEIKPYFLKSEDLNTVCNKIYISEIIQKHDLSFPQKLSLGEDGYFNMEFFCFSQNALYLDYTGYKYREVQGSATRNLDKKDYFKRAIEVYQSKTPQNFIPHLAEAEIKKLKAIKLIKSVMAYIYIYINSSATLTFSARYKYIKQMITHHHVRESLPYYKKHERLTGRYERFLLNMIEKKSCVGLCFAVTYSRVKNGQLFGR